ncbi:MAG: hypothetical protein JSV00_05195, partial [bacterium]
ESRIRGRAVLTTKQSLFNHVDRIIEAVMGHLKRKGLQNVRLVNSDWITFTGGKWTLGRVFNQRHREFRDVVDQGAIRVYLEGSEVVAAYHARTLKGLLIDLAFIGALVIPPVLIYELTPGMGLLPLLLVFFGLYSLGQRTVKIHWFMKRELPRAIHTVENVIDAVVSVQDTSGVEAQHRDLSPANLLRCAYFYRTNGFPDKARAYLAYLVEKYPWTEDADAALEELHKQRP